MVDLMLQEDMEMVVSGGDGGEQSKRRRYVVVGSNCSYLHLVSQSQQITL